MAEWQGKTVTLNSPRAIPKGAGGYGKKRKEVFVKGCSSDGGRVKRITFGDKKIRVNILVTKAEKRKVIVLGVVVSVVRQIDVVLTIGHEEIGIVK